MKLDKLIENHGLPNGLLRVAVLSNKTLQKRQWARWIATKPYGLARGRSLFTQYNVVVLCEDAVEAGVPIVACDYLHVN